MQRGQPPTAYVWVVLKDKREEGLSRKRPNFLPEVVAGKSHLLTLSADECLSFRSRRLIRPPLQPGIPHSLSSPPPLVRNAEAQFWREGGREGGRRWWRGLFDLEK